MNKILKAILLITIIAFMIPIFLTKKFDTVEVSKDNEYTKETNEEVIKEAESRVENNVENKVENKLENKNEKYEYPQYGTIKLLHTKTQEIEELAIDEYLYGVVAAEMPAKYEMEALKAQAVVARTYTIYKNISQSSKHGDANICDDFKCCQAWISKEDRLKRWEDDKKEEFWNKIVRCVDETKGQIITYEKKPINAFFHANSGGSTETPLNVWGGSGYPYLQTVTTAGEDAYDQYKSNVEYELNQFEDMIRLIHKDFDIDFNSEDCIQILERTEGNRVKKIKIGNKILTGTEVRNIFKLKSANFEINFNEGKVNFNVIGYGHGVGMSQTGADSLAKQGKNYFEIIHHFYKGVEIKQI